MISDLIFKGRLFGFIGKGEIPHFDAKKKIPLLFNQKYPS